MTLTFNVTEEDYWKFLDHYVKSSPSFTKMMRILGAIGSVLIALPSLIHNLPGDVPIAVTSAFLGVLPFLILFFIFRRFAATIVRPFAKAHARDAAGVISLDITPNGLRERSTSGETTFFWDRIGDVVTTPSHTFIYQGPSKAIVIPHNRIIEGNYHTFMQAFANVYAARQDVALQSVADTASPAIAADRVDSSTEDTAVTIGPTGV